jgi:hypothetical protein
LILFERRLRFGLGLIEEGLAPASTKERQSPQSGQRQKAKGKVERINPDDMSTKGPPVIPAVFLFGWRDRGDDDEPPQTERWR